MSAPPAVIKKTQDLLGKHVKKPPLTDKLLSKPPFRFLHDVISAVIRESGVFQGLFTEAESKSENVKDKEGKIQYLEKAIDCVSFALGVTLSAKPSKIVSGQEPAKTNEFLQAIAQIIDKKIDTSAAVEKVLSGEKPGKSPAKNINNNNNKKPADNNPYNVKNATKVNGTKKSPATGAGGKTSSNSSSRRESLAGSQGSSREPSKTREKKSPTKRSISKEEPTTNGDAIEKEVIESNAETNGNDAHEEPLTNGNHKEEVEENESNLNSLQPSAIEAEPEPAPAQAEEQKPSRKSSSTSRGRSAAQSRPETGYGKNRTNTSNDQPNAEPVEFVSNGGEATPSEPVRPGSAIKSARPRTGRLKSARPPSARPAAPRLRERNEVVLEDNFQQRPQTGKVQNVIIDNGQNDDDDADEFLVEEAPKDNLDLDTENTAGIDANSLALENGEHGALVQQILDTKKELEEGNKVIKKGVEIERESGISDFNRQREREATQREVQKLKDSIQTLTRSANPLGKLMDFLQEDVDSMQRELDTWRSENQKLQAQLRAEENLTQQSIEPLKAHLTELEATVQEQLDKISSVKSNILKNDEKIAKMVGSIGK